MLASSSLCPRDDHGIADKDIAPLLSVQFAVYILMVARKRSTMNACCAMQIVQDVRNKISHRSLSHEFNFFFSEFRSAYRGRCRSEPKPQPQCSQVCSFIYLPVCAVDVFNCETRTFSNACLVKAENCNRAEHERKLLNFSFFFIS